MIRKPRHDAITNEAQLAFLFPALKLSGTELDLVFENGKFAVYASGYYSRDELADKIMDLDAINKYYTDFRCYYDMAVNRLNDLEGTFDQVTNDSLRWQFIQDTKYTLAMEALAKRTVKFIEGMNDGEDRDAAVTLLADLRKVVQ